LGGATYAEVLAEIGNISSRGTPSEMFKFFNNGAIIGRAILFAVKWSFIIFTSLRSTYLMYKQGFQDKIF